MKLGQRFKRYRSKLGLTQKEAAELIGVKDYQLGNYETNRSEPSIEILKKMSQAYRVSIDKLVNNNWAEKELGSFIDEDEYVDMDGLIQQLNDIVEQINTANKK